MKSVREIKKFNNNRITHFSKQNIREANDCKFIESIM